MSTRPSNLALGFGSRATDCAGGVSPLPSRRGLVTSRQASIAARQAARRRFEQPVGKFPQRAQRKFSIQPFSKGWWGWKGQSPFLARPRGRNPQNDTQKIRKGRPDSPVGCRAEGNPIKGFPAGRSPAPNAQTINRASEKKRQTLRLAGAVLRFGLVRSASCRNFSEIPAAGTSAGGLRAAFPYFWVAPEAQRDKISPSAEGDQRRCLWNLPSF